MDIAQSFPAVSRKTAVSTETVAPHEHVSSPRYDIAQTEQGWCLTIQNEHCSVVQVFSTASAAQDAVGRMLEFFESMSAQAPRGRQVA